MRSKLPNLFLYLLGAVLVLNLLQANFTNLIFDEAYYWYYAKNMAWGYFDHPPMVAGMIELSSLFFNGELGVRFMSCILSAGTLITLWLIADHPKKKDYVLHFFVVTFSMTLLNAYGFFALPDTPLLFFTALFLYVYKRFIASQSIALALVLGVVMAALMYSKYNAVLVIVFVLFSNLKLIKDKYAILAVIVALTCYIPHFFWLFENDFVSINYHLFDRPNQAYSFNKFTLGYFLNLIAIFGFTFPLVYYILYKTKPKNLFERALLFLTYGVLLFFFVSSFSKRVQTQWIVVISIPMALIIFNYIVENEKIRRWFYGLGVANIVILLYLRAWLIYQPLFPIVFETHGTKKWINEIENAAVGEPIVFENSYRDASMYEFYSGKPAISLNNIRYRQNQYSIDGAEASIQNKTVYYLSKYRKKAGRSFPMGDGRHTLYGSFINNFESYRRLKCIIEPDEIEFNTAKTINMKVFNPYSEDIPLNKLRFGIAYLNDYKELRDELKIKVSPKDPTILTLKSNDTLSFTFTLPETDMKRPGYFKIGISENGLPYGINGKSIKLK